MADATLFPKSIISMPDVPPVHTMEQWKKRYVGSVSNMSYRDKMGFWKDAGSPEWFLFQETNLVVERPKDTHLLLWSPKMEINYFRKKIHSFNKKPSITVRSSTVSEDTQYYHFDGVLHRTNGPAIVSHGYTHMVGEEGFGIGPLLGVKMRVDEWWEEGQWKRTLFVPQLITGNSNIILDRRVWKNTDKILTYLKTHAVDWLSPRLFIDPMDEIEFLLNFGIVT